MQPRSYAAAALTFALSILTSTAVTATAQRTFVSSHGNDANPCSLAMPCRTFGAAIVQTLTGGEVVVLDSAGYGPVTITQAVSITAPPGIYAGISVPPLTFEGIVVNASALSVVELRGLTIVATGSNQDGIHYLAGGGLTVERCRISAFGGAGIITENLIPSAGVVVRDTAISGPALGVGIGVYVGTGATATLDGVSAEWLAIGVQVHGGVLAMRSGTISDVQEGVAVNSAGQVSMDGVTISRATAAGVQAYNQVAASSISVHVIRSQINASGYGIYVITTAGFSTVHVTDSVLADNSSGVYTTGGGTATVSGSTIVGNTNGLNSVNGLIYTMQNNQVRDNIHNLIGTIIPLTFD